MRRKLNYSLPVFLLCTCLASLSAQEKTKDYVNSWQGVSNLEVSHRHGILDVIPVDENEVRLEASISVTADDSEDAEIVINHFYIDDRKFSDELELETQFDTRDWATSNGKTTIKFEDGSKAKGIKTIEIKYKLYVPKLKSLKLSNKYYDIEIHGNIDGELFIKQYDSKVSGHEVSGKLHLELKYGKGEFEKCANADIALYDSELNLEYATDVELESKYSEFNITHCNSINVDSYDDEGLIRTTVSNLRINDKYSEYILGTAKTAEILSYDGTVTLDKAESYSGKSKYSEIKINTVGSIDLESSYDDQYELGTVNEFSCQDSKYSEYEIEKLGKSLEITSYDEDISVAEVAPTFELLDIHCKYTDLDLPLRSIPGYRIEAQTKYGSLKYPEPSGNVVQKEVNDNLELRADIGKADAKARVIINAYDSSIRLN